MSIKVKWSLSVENGDTKRVDQDDDIIYVMSPDDYIKLVQKHFGHNYALDTLKLIMHAKIDMRWFARKRIDLFMETGILFFNLSPEGDIKML